jgi:hypothetical protein
MMSLSGGGQYERSPAFSLFEHRAFLDHLFMLIFATVAALVLIREWGLSYAELIPYATPGFIAFGLFSLPSGWLADRWSREGMMTVFFIGAGLAAIATSTAATPLQIGVGLFIVGIFASIYHPVGLAMVARGGSRMGHDIALNGVFGNLGVGVAALLTGFLIDQTSWRGFLEPRCGFRCDQSGLWLAFSRSRGHQKCGQRVDRHTLRASRCPLPRNKRRMARNAHSRHCHYFLQHRGFEHHFPGHHVHFAQGVRGASRGHKPICNSNWRPGIRRLCYRLHGSDRCWQSARPAAGLHLRRHHPDRVLLNDAGPH